MKLNQPDQSNSIDKILYYINRYRDIIVLTLIVVLIAALVLTTITFYNNVELLKSDPCKLCMEKALIRLTF